MAQAPAKKAGKRAAATGRALRSVQGTPDGLDLDAIAAEGKPYPVKLGGTWYELSDINDIDTEIVLAADTGSLTAISTCIRMGFGDMSDEMLGERGAEIDEEARATWLTFNSNRLSIRQATALFKGWLAHSGLQQGE